MYIYISFVFLLGRLFLGLDFNFIFIFRYSTTTSEPKILVLWKMSRIHRRTKVLEKEESALLETQFSPMDTPTLGK